MAHKLERSLSSLTAIAAATLLLSTPALAQSQPATDAAPQPPAAAAAAPAPAPDVQPPAIQPPAAATPDTAPAAATPAPVMTTNPVVQPVPDSSQTASTPAPVAQPPAPQATRTTTQPRTITHTTSRVTPAPQAAGGIPAATPAQKPAPSDAPSPGLTRRDPAGLYTADGSAVATTTTTQTATHQSPYARYWPLEAAGGIIVLGLIGYTFTRRREEEDEDVVYTTPATEPVAAVPAAPVSAAMATTPARSLADVPSATLAVEETPAASVLPAGPVPTGAAREALLKRMVAAPPDAANPFHTVKVRLRRARLILASRKQALREQATETFDWRTYKPSLKATTLGGKAEAPTRVKRETVK